jgi:hypothetical protein
MFLQDFNFLDVYDVIQESTSNERVYKLRGAFSKANIVNKNRRVYPYEVLSETVQTLQEDIKNGGFVGEINHPSTPQVDMSKISHKITQLAITEDGTVLGEMVPAGPKKDDLIRLMEDGIRIGVSTRSTGKVKPYNGPLSEGQSGLVEVLPGLKMHAIDIVFNPSAGTFPTKIMESEDFESSISMGSTVKFREVWNTVFN